MEFFFIFDCSLITKAYLFLAPSTKKQKGLQVQKNTVHGYERGAYDGIEEGRLSDVGEANDSSPEVHAQPGAR